MPFCNGSPLSMQAVGNDMKRSEGSGTGDPGAAEAPTRIIRAGRRKTSLSAEGYPTALSPRGAGVVLEETEPTAKQFVVRVNGDVQLAARRC